MGRLASASRRFFHPAAISDILETILPHFNGTDVNVCIFWLLRQHFILRQEQSVLANEYYLLTFLPQSHPQSYFPMLFRLWRTINSYIFDGRLLEFMAQLAEMHTDPAVSDPQRIKDIPDDAKSDDESRPTWKDDDLKSDGPWYGIYKDVGIFTDMDWQFIMCKCLAFMGV